MAKRNNAAWKANKAARVAAAGTLSAGQGGTFDDDGYFVLSDHTETIHDHVELMAAYRAGRRDFSGTYIPYFVGDPQDSLAGASFKGAQIDTMLLNGTSLEGADFTKASINGISANNADFSEAIFDGARISSGSIHDSDLSRFSAVGMHMGQGGESYRGRVLFERNKMNGVDFSYALFGEVDNHVQIDFDTNDMVESNWEGSTAHFANFHDNNMIESNFTRADFERASFDLSDVSYADFTAASLRGLQVPAGNWSHATLRAADLSTAQSGRNNSYSDSVTRAPSWHAEGVNLEGARLNNALLNNAQLRGARLVNANVAGTDLHGSDLSYANLSNLLNLEKADLNGVDLTGATFKR